MDIGVYVDLVRADLETAKERRKIDLPPSFVEEKWKENGTTLRRSVCYDERQKTGLTLIETLLATEHTRRRNHDE